MIVKIVCISLFAFVILRTFIKYYKISQSKAILNKLYKTSRKRFRSKTRDNTIKALSTENFDVLIIGGGCSGAGCALDAATRGLKVALIEALDYGSEASSKSTKLLHGGLRYLIKAIKNLSLSHFLLVMNALEERQSVMKMAPYLTYTVRIMVPIYDVLEIPYYWILTKLYDWMSCGRSLGGSYLIYKKQASLYLSDLRAGDIKGSMVYYDGMMDDSRLNVMLAMTSSFYGATIANHVKFQNFVKDDAGRIIKVSCTNELTNTKFEIQAQVVISTVGAFTDSIRTKGIGKPSSLMTESAGTHIVLPKEFGPFNIGLVETQTNDNRIMFILPWKDNVLVGSTEIKRPLTPQINPTVEEINFLINETKKYIKKEIHITDVMSAWTGFRPLPQDRSTSNTESISRRFEVMDEGNGLITMMGGKWTLFRVSAEKTIDLAIKSYGLKPRNICLTNYIEILGSRKYSRNIFYGIARLLDVDVEYAKHLLNLYGDRAFLLEDYLKKYPENLSSKYPFKAAEAIYCVEHENAMTTHGIVNIRFRIGFYDVKEAAKVCEKVERLLKTYFKWTEAEIARNEDYTKKSLESLGYGIISDSTK